MTEPATAPEVARRLADALERAGLPYAVGGAIAYGLHAPPRATNDVDLNLFIPVADLDRAFDAFVAAGAVVDRDAARVSARERGDFIVRVDGTAVTFAAGSSTWWAKRTVESRFGIRSGD